MKGNLLMILKMDLVNFIFLMEKYLREPSDKILFGDKECFIEEMEARYMGYGVRIY
jgi:hypothetical protein